MKEKWHRIVERNERDEKRHITAYSGRESRNTDSREDFNARIEREGNMFLDEVKGVRDSKEQLINSDEK